MTERDPRIGEARGGFTGETWAKPVEISFGEYARYIEGQGPVWVTLDLDGWDGYTVEVQAGLQQGKPRVFG
ncbi:hypothetical protein N9D66_02145, partial [Candidatus Nanopelagicales bacterium]|nr:hypothetical protein [Candidatus Nanopelagicales bacterium]